MASPLAVAMMGGSGGNEGVGMFGLDPAIMAAQPDIQLGQALMQGGLSTAPASPWQALARVAQAAAGGYLQRGAMSDLAKAYANTSENMAQAIEQTVPNHPIIAALRSPDPTVRMAAMQQAGKVLTLLSEPQRTGPDQTVNVGGQPMAQGNPALAGRVAAAKAPYESGGEATFNGPNGPTQMPISAATRAGMQPGVTPSAAVPPPGPQKPAGSILPNGEQIMGGGASPSPSAAVQPPATFDQRFNPSLASTAQIAGAKTAAEEGAKNEAEFGDLLKPQGPLKPGPGTTEPIKSPSGTMIPALKDQGPIPTNPAQLKDAVPAWQKTVSEWNAAIGPSQQAEQRLQTIAGAFKQIESGTWQTNKAQIAGIVKSLGLDPTKFNLDDPSQVQLALHENYVETLQQLKASQPRFSQMEFKALSANKEHPDLQPAANLQMLAEDIGTLRQSRDLPSDFTAAKANGWVNPQSFEQAWLRQNPLSGYVDRAKKEIGPLKGMPGFQGATKPGGAYVWTPDGGIAPK